MSMHSINTGFSHNINAESNQDQDPQTDLTIV